MINDPALTSDTTLLQLYARNQDPEAFDELTKRYAGLVYGTCKRVLQSHDDAQDVSQDCFLELARKAGSVRSSLPAYLHHLARTRSIDAIRKATTRRHHEKEALLNSPGPDPTWAEIAPLIDDALASLPERYRVPIILHYLQGHTQAQIANELSTSQPTTCRNIDRGISMLRDHLSASGVLVTTAVLTTLLTENASTAAPAAVIASLGKLALSGITQSAATSTGLAALIAPMLGTLAGKLAMGILGLATVGVIANSAATAIRTKTAPAYVPPFTGVTRATGQEAIDLGEKARKGALDAALRITSGSGTVYVQTWAEVQPGEIYDSQKTYQIVFSGPEYACEVRDVFQWIKPPAARSNRQVSKTPRIQTFRLWSDGLHATAYELGTNHATSGTFTDPANGFGPAPSQHSWVRDDISIWSHQDLVIGSPYTRTDSAGYTSICKQTGAGKQILNGDECIVVESTLTTTPSKGGKNVIVAWVNTKKGYALTKERIYTQRTATSKQYIAVELNIVLKDYGHGIWAPSRITREAFREGTAGNPRLFERVVKTYDPNFQINIPINEKALTPTLPQGTSITELK